MVGITSLEYGQLAQRVQSDFTPYSASGHLTLSVAAGRVSYTFGLKGPSFPGMLCMQTHRSETERDATGLAVRAGSDLPARIQL